MDNIGSEIGQKMRCAVKAKLIELGTGYIDDELPDYVMIMVANKRSKQQMVDDLNLFLGMNTHIFVTWLHEVLDKLQEVTLPAPPPPKISKRKDHEKKKKEKKKKDVTSANNLPALPSITEVIKEGFIQRAKQDLQVESQVKTKSDEKTPPPPSISGNTTANGDGFDIPTISDITKEAMEKRKHEKELEQLAELQKKIFIAKKQLQTMVSDDSDDDINNASLTNNAKNSSSAPVGVPTRTNIHINPQFFERNERIAPNSNNNNSTKIHDRLGTKNTIEDKSNLQEDTNTENRRVVKLSAIRRAEREIYVPAFRRSEVEKQRLDSKERQNTRDRNRRETPEKRGPLQNRVQFDHRSRTRDDRKNSVRGRTILDRSRLRESSNRRSRSRSKSPLRRRRTPIKSFSKERRPFIKTRLEVTSMRKDTDDEEETREKVASRVFVIPQKVLSDEDDVDVPVNSIIKIKPRVVPEKQANKMLLLRAMADAQRSTFGSLLTKADETKARERRSIKDRLTIQVANVEEDELDLTFEDIVIDEDEYVPAPVSKTSESESDNYLYIPRKKVATKFLAVEESDEYDPDEMLVKKDTNTKFVVTLDNNEKGKVVAGKKSSASSKQTVKKGSIKDRIGYRMQIEEDEEAKKRRKERFEQGYERVEDNSKNRQLNKSRSRSPQERKRKFDSPQRSKSPVLRNHSNERKSDLWGDNKSDEVQATHRRRSRARTISPINFDLTDEETRSRSSHEGQSDKDARKRSPKDGESRAKIKKLEPTRKFDNIPSLLSTVTVADSSIKSKPKERCKFFPNCRDGSACEFHHPSAPCNAFPSCKYGDKCAYLHPLCKFDLTCTRPNCNFMHSTPVKSNAAPPLASSILPSQNYKPISLASLPAICKFFPNCSNTLCTFYHPKPCRFGKLCHNKIECNFYHQDLPTKDKLKWVSSGI